METNSMINYTLTTNIKYVIVYIVYMHTYYIMHRLISSCFYQDKHYRNSLITCTNI